MGYNRAMPWDVIGHGWAVALLQRHLETARVRHAYLLTGPPGIGKRTLALRLAQALMCGEPPVAGAFCGACRACRLVRTEAHPDLHIVSRAEGKSEIGIDQVRELQRQLSLTPVEARRRVALLPDFQEASDGASNALLKTLEEPAGETVLLVTAVAAEAVLPTLASRCEVLALRPVAAEDIAAGLRARGAPEDRAELLSALSAGRPGWALTAHESPALLQARDRALADLERLLHGSRADRFAFVERAHQDHELIRESLETWLTFWRDVLVTAHAAQARLGNLDRKEWVESTARHVGARQARRAALAVERTLTALERHANTRLALETLMLDFPHLQTA